MKKKRSKLNAVDAEGKAELAVLRRENLSDLNTFACLLVTFLFYSFLTVMMWFLPTQPENAAPTNVVRWIASGLVVGIFIWGASWFGSLWVGNSRKRAALRRDIFHGHLLKR